MLLMNGVWDFISFISICINTSCCAPIAGMHLGLWLDQLDQTNPAAIFLMSLCMLTLCTARVCVCIDESLWSVAVFSYFIEFVFGSVGVYLGLLHIYKGAFVALSSGVLAVIVIIFH